MFITRFTKDDGFIEDYYYHFKEDAIQHLDLFKTDNSGLYTSIVVINDSSNVIVKALIFKLGQNQ